MRSQADRRHKMQQYPALKIFTKTKTQLENFSGFLVTPLHKQTKLIQKVTTRSKLKIPPQRPELEKHYVKSFNSL